MLPTKPLIDFYIHNSNGQKPWVFACKLIEKLDLQKKIYVHTRSKEEANHLDQLLWTYKDICFIPHCLLNTGDAPVQIGYSTLPDQLDVFINLSDLFPESFNQYHNIIEFVFIDPTMQQLARERYKRYRAALCTITTHKLKEQDYEL